MPTGKIRELRRDPVTGKDYGEVIDDNSGKHFPFETAANMFSIYEQVSWEKEPTPERLTGSMKGRIDAVRISKL